MTPIMRMIKLIGINYSIHIMSNFIKKGLYHGDLIKKNSFFRIQMVL